MGFGRIKPLYIGGVTKRLPVKVVLSDIEPKDKHVVWIKPVDDDGIISYKAYANVFNIWDEILTLEVLILKLLANRK